MQLRRGPLHAQAAKFVLIERENPQDFHFEPFDIQAEIIDPIGRSMLPQHVVERPRFYQVLPFRHAPIGIHASEIDLIDVFPQAASPRCCL